MQKLVNKNEYTLQTSINPAFHQKVRKADERISEVCLVILNEEIPVNGVGMPFAGVFAFICHHSKLERITYMISQYSKNIIWS